MSASKQIAITILEQLKAGVVPGRGNMRTIGGIQAMGCWGYRTPSVVENGLQFKVNARKLRNGTVKVTLDRGQDLYDVEYLNVRGRLIEHSTGVFASELTDVIDSIIEAD